MDEGRDERVIGAEDGDGSDFNVDINCLHSKGNRLKNIFTKFFKKCTLCGKKGGLLKKMMKCKNCGIILHSKCALKYIEKKKKEKEHSSLKYVEEVNQPYNEENNDHSIYYEDFQELNEPDLNEENEEHLNQEEQHFVLINHPEILHITSTLDNDQKDQNTCPNIYQNEQHEELNDIQNQNDVSSLFTDNIQTNGNDNNGNEDDENRPMLDEIRKYSENTFNRFNTVNQGKEHKRERNVNDKNCDQNMFIDCAIIVHRKFKIKDIEQKKNNLNLNDVEGTHNEENNEGNNNHIEQKKNNLNLNEVEGTHNEENNDDNNNHSICQEVQEQNESHLNEENEKQCNLNDVEIFYSYKNQEEQHSVLNNHPEILNITSTLNNDQKDQNPSPNIYQKKQHKELNDIQNDIFDSYSDMERLFSYITPSNIIETTQLLIFDLRTRKNAENIIKLLFLKVKNDDKYITEYIKMCKMMKKKVIRDYNSENKIIMITFEEIMTKYCKELLDTEIKKHVVFNNDTSIISKETYTFIGELYNNELLITDIVFTFVYNVLSHKLSKNVLYIICHFIQVIGKKLKKIHYVNQIRERLKEHISYNVSEQIMDLLSFHKNNWDVAFTTHVLRTMSSIAPILENENIKEENIYELEEYYNINCLDNNDMPKQLLLEPKDNIVDLNVCQRQDIPMQLLLEQEDNIAILNESQSSLNDNGQTNKNDNNGKIDDEKRSNIEELHDGDTNSNNSFDNFNIHENLNKQNKDQEQSTNEEENWIAIENKIIDFFQSMPNNVVTEKDFGQIAKLCGCPFYLRKPMYNDCDGGLNDTVDQRKFLKYWKGVCSMCKDLPSILIRILSRSTVTKFVSQKDLRSIVQDVIDSHPKLINLRKAPAYHDIYIRTVLSRLFYEVNSSWSGFIDASEIRRSRLIDEIKSLEQDYFIDDTKSCFNYEHFFVIFHQFEALAYKGDTIIWKSVLKEYNNYSLNPRVIDSLFCGSMIRNKQYRGNFKKFMSYEEFVWFLLAEVDPTQPRAIEYWFRCMNVSGDGFLKYDDLAYYYEEQIRRMKKMNLTPVPNMDELYQFLESIKPKYNNKISLDDFKDSNMTALFTTKFINVKKYLSLMDAAHTSPSNSKSFDVDIISNWEKFAEEAYNHYIAPVSPIKNKKRTKRNGDNRKYRAMTRNNYNNYHNY